ncbi:hypothetical protein H5410_018177, partial [Solanum commersonii]
VTTIPMKEFYTADVDNFGQLFKMTGSLNKSFEACFHLHCFQGGPKTHTPFSSFYTLISLVLYYRYSQAQANRKVSALFGGTQDKFVASKKTVYPLEKLVTYSFLCNIN